jgi:ketosteroid isomerase-like protein
MNLLKKYPIIFVLIAAIIICLVVIVIYRDYDPSKSDELPPSLTASINKFYDSIKNDDNETRISLFSEGATMMPNHWTRIEGKENIAKSIRAGQGAVFKIRDRELIDSGISRELAYTVNSYHYTYHVKEDSPQWHSTKNVHIWKMDNDGNWKLHLDIWNSNVPISAFDNE